MLRNKANDLLSFERLNLSGKVKIADVNRIQQRCQIFTLSCCGISSRTIAWFVNSHPSTVRRWTLRARNVEDLIDHNRSGRPPVHTEEIGLKTIAFYCQVSPLPGCNAWSLRWAEKYLQDHNEIIGCAISDSTIHRILKQHALRPHLRKYYLAITDPDFFPKMQHVIDLYLQPPEFLFNFDECTALQAKLPLAPDLPAEADRPICEEFEYCRNGTTDLMAFLNYKTGEVFGRCTTNHKTPTLINVFREHVNTLPADVPIHYIMDNLNTHFNNDFCHAVGELSNVTYTPLKTGAERRRWLQKENKRIVIHFVPFHGSWLNMIEIWFGILSKKCLKHTSSESVEILQEIIEAFIDTWNKSFAHPFTWKYTGDGLFEKAISRFNKLLLIESTQMDIKFLTKQLLLMANIPKIYKNATQTAVWKQLRELSHSRSAFINNIINGTSKKQQKDRAVKALDQLATLLCLS